MFIYVDELHLKGICRWWEEATCEGRTGARRKAKSKTKSQRRAEAACRNSKTDCRCRATKVPTFPECDQWQGTRGDFFNALLLDCSKISMMLFFCSVPMMSDILTYWKCSATEHLTLNNDEIVLKMTGKPMQLKVLNSSTFRGIVL